MVVLDLDDFKDINDTHGHGAGDEVLRTVANRLTQAMRPGDTASRFGGDEFAILVEHMPSAAAADGVAARVLEAFLAPFIVNDELVFMNTSAGVVVVGADEQDLDLTELLMRADLALYAAKKAGKGRFQRYEDDLRTAMLDRVTRRTELKRAVEQNEFLVQYQPVVNIETGEIVGAEALVRWQHPRRGVVGPYDFIGLAEESGLIVELGRWVLDTACAQARLWQEPPVAGFGCASTSRAASSKRPLSWTRCATRCAGMGSPRARWFSSSPRRCCSRTEPRCRGGSPSCGTSA